MLLATLASALLFSHPGHGGDVAATSSPVPEWVVSVPMAKVMSRRRGTPILAVVANDASRAGRLTALLDDADNRRLLHGFVMVQAIGSTESERLSPGQEPPAFPQIHFVSPSGKVVKRLSGFLRSSDLKHAAEWVRMGLGPLPSSDEPSAQLKRAVVRAMQGDVREAQRTLQSVDPGAFPELRAEVYGAIMDEMRAKNRMAEAIRAANEAVRLSTQPDQKLRWRIRRAINYARFGDRQFAATELFACAQTPGMSLEDSSQLRETAIRISDPLFMPQGPR